MGHKERSINPDKNIPRQSCLLGNLICLLSLCLTISVFFAVAEGYLRFIFRVDGKTTQDMFLPDQNLGWILQPGQYVDISLTIKKKTSISINSLGFRDREISLRAKAAKKRITVIGDSFVFGQVLAYDERFTEVLQAMIGDDWEIINISVPGYGTGQELLFLQELKFKGYEVGDKVMLVFFTNDILDNVGLDYGTGTCNPLQPVFEVKNKRLVICKFPKRADHQKAQRSKGFVGNSLVVNSLTQLAINWAGRHPEFVRFIIAAGIDIELPRAPGIITGWYSRDWQKHWRVTQEILNYASTEMFDKVDFSIIYIPSPLQVEPSMLAVIDNLKSSSSKFAEFLGDIDRPNRTLKNFCQRNNISFIDTTPMIRKKCGNGPVYFLQEGHLNPAGSRIVAEILSDVLLEK